MKEDYQKALKKLISFFLLNPGQESGKKWLCKKWMLLTMSFVNFYQINLYFFCLKFLVLCDISAEFYLNFKFIIIKIIMYSNCAITSFKHLWFIFKNIWSFNEMEMEINVINNKIFTKLYLQIRVREKEI